MIRSRYAPRFSLLIRFNVGLALLFLAGACSRYEAVRVPANYDTLPGVVDLRGGAPWPAAYARLFPRIESFRMSSYVTTTYTPPIGRSMAPIQPLNVSLIAAGPESVRMRALLPGPEPTLFDLVLDGGYLRVYVPQWGMEFCGDLDAATPPDEGWSVLRWIGRLFGRSSASAGSPLAQRIGFEPSDVVSIITVGSEIASAGPALKWSEKGTIRLPRKEGGGLTAVKLDRQTHLPRTAYFERGSHKWRVEYLAWDLVDVGGEFGAAASSGHQVLMPSRFVIKRRWPNLKVEIRKRDGDSETAQYLIATPHPNAFTLRPPPGTPKASLEDLGAAIDANLGR